jgi:hypothetical protein
MGVEDNKFQIDDLTDTTSFFEWASKTNTELIAKLNKMSVYDGLSGDGINVVVGLSGDSQVGSGTTHGISAGDLFVELSGTVEKGMTFNGDVTINGLLNYDFSQSFSGVPLVSVTVQGATSGLSQGDVVRFAENLTDTNLGTFNGVTLAKADSATSAEVFGIVNGLSGNDEVEVVISGEFNYPSGGLDIGCVQFLSASSAGELSSAEPNIIGQVSKPVAIATAANKGILYNFRGQQLTATGGTGASQGDNNSFFITGFSSPDANGRTVEKGKMVTYNFGEGRFEITNGSSTNSVEQIVGIIAEDSSTLGTGVVKVVSSGVILNANDLVSSNVGPLYVTSNGDLQPIFSGGGFGTGTPVAMGMLLGSDTALIINFTTGNGGQIGGGFGGFATSSLPAGGLPEGEGSRVPAGGFFVPAANQARQFSRNSPPVLLGATAATGGAVYVNENELINGAMTVWQRGIGTSSAYTGTGGTYFADRWARVDGSTATSKTYSIERKEFTDTQTDVEGNPLYYARLNHTATPTNGIEIENRVEGVDSFRGENMSFSFYARTNGASGATCNVFVKQNYGTTGASSTETITDLGSIRFESDWAKYITVFGVPELTQSKDNTDSFFSVGIKDLPSGTAIDLAQAKLERGNAATPVEPRNIDEEYSLCARYFQRSYAPDVSSRAVTLNSGIPDPSSVNFTSINPDSDHYHRFPVRMRGNPDVTIYSPLDGATGTAYNRTARKNLEKTSGSEGFGGTTRIAPAGSTTINTPVKTKDGIYFDVLTGFVNYDAISVHYVANSDINIDID